MFSIHDIKQNSQLPNQLEFKFDRVVPNNINGYALVLTDRLLV